MEQATFVSWFRYWGNLPWMEVISGCICTIYNKEVRFSASKKERTYIGLVFPDLHRPLLTLDLELDFLLFQVWHSSPSMSPHSRCAPRPSPSASHIWSEARSMGRSATPGRGGNRAQAEERTMQVPGIPKGLAMPELTTRRKPPWSNPSSGRPAAGD